MVGITIGPGTREGYSEVRFASKPSGEVRDALKGAGFRWASSSGCWYGRTDRLGALPQGLLDRADRAGTAAAEPAPCSVRESLAAESGAVAAMRAELAALRAEVGALRTGAMLAPVAAPVAHVAAEVAAAFGLAGAPASLVKVTGPDSVASRIVAAKSRPSVAPKVGGIGRTLDVSAAGQWV